MQMIIEGEDVPIQDLEVDDALTQEPKVDDVFGDSEKGPND